MKHKTLPWKEIRKGIGRPTGSPITVLVDYILGSGLSEYLFPATMHINLRIGRQADFSRNDGELTIEYQEDQDHVLFKYYESTSKEPWVVSCKGNEITATFTHVLTRRLRWIQE